MKRMNIKLEEQKQRNDKFNQEIVKLYEINEWQNEIITMRTNSENSPSVYIPPREKPRVPSRENFNILYNIVDRQRHNALFSDRKKWTKYYKKLNQMFKRSSSTHRIPYNHQVINI